MEASATIGRVIGLLAAPAAALGSLLRGARLFHPEGVLYRAEVRPLAGGALARSLAGPALVRLSGALWRAKAGENEGAEPALPDILGAAVRFQPGEATAQDLLFATFRSAALLPLGLFTTDVHDFLGNTYYAGLPFEAPELGRVELRLDPQPTPPSGRDRREKLQRAVAAGLAVLWLEARQQHPGAPWRRLAALELRERVPGGGETLRFDPFHAGLGIQPVGLLQTVRGVVYPASQLGRMLARQAREYLGARSRT